MPQRERDILSETIGIKEPTGRTRGLRNLASWGKVFSGDKDERRRQRKRAKAEVMKQEIMDSLKAEFEAKMAAMEERLASQTVKKRCHSQAHAHIGVAAPRHLTRLLPSTHSVVQRSASCK